MLSYCFLPHYLMTQKTVFGQAAHKDTSQLHITLCSSCHAGRVPVNVYTSSSLIYFSFLGLYYLAMCGQTFKLNSLVH